MEAVSRTQNKQGKLWKSIKEHKTLYLLMLPGLLYSAHVWPCDCF